MVRVLRPTIKLRITIKLCLFNRSNKQVPKILQTFVSRFPQIRTKITPTLGGSTPSITHGGPRALPPLVLVVLLDVGRLSLEGLDVRTMIVHRRQHPALVPLPAPEGPPDGAPAGGVVDLLARQRRQPAAQGLQDGVAGADVPLLDQGHVDVRVLREKHPQKVSMNLQDLWQSMVRRLTAEQCEQRKWTSVVAKYSGRENSIEFSLST